MSAAGDHDDAADSAGGSLLPLRMLNEFVYCPRLFHWMHVEGRWADNEFTVEGQHVHRRVDAIDHVLPDAAGSADAESAEDDSAEGDPVPAITRSVHLSSERLGLVGKLDLVATAGDEATPVETKRGRVPKNAQRSWEPERVQLMAQGMLLREHGYRCSRGVLYFAGSRTRVDVPFTAELEARTVVAIDEAKRAASSTVLPDPLEDSPKCNACSLNGICLPDETLALRDVPVDAAAPKVRRLYPARDEAVPLYVQEQGATIGKQKGTLIVRKQGEELSRVRLRDVSQVVVCGNVMITAQTVHLLCEAAVPIVHLSTGHWLSGVTYGITLRNAYDRAAQFAAAADSGRRLAVARAIVLAKGHNQRTLLMRNAQPRPTAALRSIDAALQQVGDAGTVDQLLGIEGAIAAQYFASFGDMLRPRDIDTDWEFDRRNRRPPRDPVNALLSFAYAMLSKECTVALLGEGLDPWWGLFHRPRHGRPALALDLMEEFRPVVADSAVLSAINGGMVGNRDFQRSNAGCLLQASGRRAFLRAFESRLDQLVTHPIFAYRCSWRSVIRLQARLLARWLRGDVPRYVGMRTR